MEKRGWKSLGQVFGRRGSKIKMVVGVVEVNMLKGRLLRLEHLLDELLKGRFCSFVQNIH